MLFIELFNQFRRLDAQQTIPLLASKLYMYWLHEFNQERWPALIYRRANQVYTDLNVDKKSLPAAITVLEARGLLRYVPGNTTRAATWEMNYGKAADWLPAVGNFSPQTDENVGNISPQAAATKGKNSPSLPTSEPEDSETKGKNSPLIRNRPTSSRVEDQPTPSASECACVGEAAEEITTAPLPTEISTLVPPVAEPPHAAASRPVAAAELPAALQAEVKALATEMGQMWGLTEQQGFPGWSRLYAFAKHEAQQGRLPTLRQQLAGYQAGHMRPGVRAHKLADWLGDPQHPDGPYSNGIWCSCQWPTIAAQVQARPGQPEAQSPRATTTRRQAQPQEW